ncbi:MAG: hypothetical protein KBG47_01600 [Bacteroidia bacterium]|nr:hypothetical protein [Sphingobacteriaceae bacterium]MBK7817179.1 hypothetical protein [Sphingobacteriaceae bacterium]MBP9068171.1 hypothetical protein [Bacteroidia bacterium]
MDIDDEIISAVGTFKATVYLLKGNIVKIVPHENIEMDVKDLEEIQKIKFDLVGERKYAVMFVTPDMGVMTKEGRAFASGPLVNRNAVAKAIVIKNIGMRIMASFFIKFNKPLVEHRLFEKEEDAIQWLRNKLDTTP